MAEKKQESGFTVTDRRLFTEDGELRQKFAKKQKRPRPQGCGRPCQAVPVIGKEDAGPEVPPMPTVAEQKAQADAYRKSSGCADSGWS